MRKRILFCTHSIDNGGSAKSLYVTLKYLPQEFAPAILSLRDAAANGFYFEYYQKNRIPVFIMPFGWLPVSYVNCPINLEVQKKRTLGMRPAIPQLNWIGAAADYVCFNGYPATSLAPYFDSNIPQSLIAREQLLAGPERTRIERFLRCHIKKAVAIGPAEASQLAAMGVPVEIVFNSAEREPEYFPPPELPLRFAVFSRFGPDKGLDTLFEAVRIAKNRLLDKSARVTVYGAHGRQDFGLEKEIAAFIKKYGLEDAISIEEWTNDVERAMKNAHCVIRPDKSGSPWGRDIIEAMSVGRPVVAAGSNGVFVKEDLTGWLVPVNDPQALAKRLEELLENPGAIQKAGLTAFEFARDNFNPVVNSAKIVNYLFK